MVTLLRSIEIRRSSIHGFEVPLDAGDFLKMGFLVN